ncbi:MAG: translation initiation factor 1 [Candidatus Endobugula sp.]|jgi:translation initiation factor 1
MYIASIISPRPINTEPIKTKDYTMKKNTRLVYSTETGRIKPKYKASSTATIEDNSSDGIVRIHRETKGRKGNGVSLVKGLSLDDKALKVLAKTLKQKMGVGGSIKEGIIEIQSDQRDKLKSLLEGMGHTVKLAGS